MGVMADKAILATKVEKEKAVCAIAYVISIANKMGKTPTQYDIFKSIFLADKLHMNKYGRPVTYDTYVAMKHGPVPSFVYDVVKDEDEFLAKAELKHLWSRSEKDEKGRYQFSDATDDSSEDFLSQSDLSTLRYGIETVLNLGFMQIRRLTHQDPAYVNAWDDEASAKAFPMRIELLFERPDDEAAENIAMLSYGK
jgi:uncharacterized phage-associated protein